MATGGRLNVATRWDNEPKHVLIDRIKMLEEEIKIVKQRMDELRKAKNQTIIKREHEFVEVGNPISEKDIQSSARVRELEEKMARLRKDHTAQITQLREEKDKEISRLNDNIVIARTETRKGPCGHESDLDELRAKITQLENKKDEANAESEAQKDIIDGLWFQLSEKEAEWCDKEEKMQYQFEKTLQTIQEGMSEKEARRMQAKLDALQKSGGFDLDDDNDNSGKTE